MRIGIIDLGTNSVRFDIHELSPRKPPLRLHREKLMVRLGQGVFLKGRLDSRSTRRTIQVFKSFKRTADHFHVGKIVAFATSALREAVDRERFLKELKRQSGIDVRVISGAEEARLIAQGVLRNEKSLKGRFALVDIGGGSTEISVCQNARILKSSSFGLGVARLHQVFLKSSPPKALKRGTPPIEATRGFIRETLSSKMEAERWPKASRIVGSSGTILALSKLIAAHARAKKRSFQRKNLKKLVKEMSALTTRELMKLPGMEPKRVDLILAGAVLLEEIMETIGAKTATVTEFALRDGILAEESRGARARLKIPLSFRIEDLRRKAQRFGMSSERSGRILKLAETLFEGLKPLHKLKNEWHPYLQAAGLLRDLGEAIHSSKRAEHSHYIARNLDVPGLQEWESEFIAELCLRHANGKGLGKQALEFATAARRNAFLKLLALLRIVDALDRNPRSPVRIKRVSIRKKHAVIRISGGSGTDLEILRVEQKKELFEKLFKKALLVQR